MHAVVMCEGSTCLWLCAYCSPPYLFKAGSLRAGAVMAQQLKVLAVLPEDTCLILSIHMSALNHL